MRGQHTFWMGVKVNGVGEAYRRKGMLGALSHRIVLID